MKYIVKSESGITIHNEKTVQINISLKAYLNKQSIKNGSTMQGRIDAVKCLFDKKGLVPLFIDNDTVLIFSKSIRNLDAVIINQRRVLSIIKQDNVSKIIFDDLSELRIDVPYKRILNQYMLAKSICF